MIRVIRKRYNAVRWLALTSVRDENKEHRIFHNKSPQTQRKPAN